MEGSTGGGQGTDVGGLLTAGALRIKGSITFIDPEVGRVRERVWGKGEGMGEGLGVEKCWVLGWSERESLQVSLLHPCKA